MSIDVVIERVINYVATNILSGDQGYLSADTPLANSGIFDSFSAMMFANFLEEEFRVTVETEQLNGKDFASIQAIADWIVRSSTGQTHTN